jgi:uncharacterized protein
VRGRRWPAVAAICLASTCAAGAGSPAAATSTQAQTALPELDAPVNDFANIIDRASADELDRVSRALRAASGDVIVVATVPTVEPYGDIREYATRLFENRGRGIGDRGKDNGLLILLALKERRVWIEVGYGLEEWVTDGYAGETSRNVMAPEFRQGRYGAGLLAGATRIAGRIAEGRNVQLDGISIPPDDPASAPRREISVNWIIVLFILIVVISRLSGGPGRSVRRWGRRGWSGWSSGVGPFGGGFGGGRGGSFGGGFGGFGGGRSGGGGGGSGW